MKNLWRNTALVALIALAALPGTASAVHCPADLDDDDAEWPH